MVTRSGRAYAAENRATGHRHASPPLQEHQVGSATHVHADTLLCDHSPIHRPERPVGDVHCQPVTIDAAQDTPHASSQVEQAGVASVPADSARIDKGPSAQPYVDEVSKSRRPLAGSSATIRLCLPSLLLAALIVVVGSLYLHNSNLSQGSYASDNKLNLLLNAISTQVPADESWRRLIEAVPDVMRGARVGKAAGFLLVCTHKTDCARALTVVRSSLSCDPGACLSFSAARFGPLVSDAAGTLQKEAALYFQQHPGGLMILEDVQLISVHALNPIHNILSELGSLQHMGQSVPTTNALVLLTMYMPDLGPLNADALETQAKNTLVSTLLSQDTSDQFRLRVAAFRRRLDFTFLVASA